MSGRPAPLTAAVLLAACAHSGLRLDALPRSFSEGAVERFGPAALAIESGEIVSFTLAEAAEVALVAVTADGAVSVLYPYSPGESSRFEAGPHTLVVPMSLEWAPDPSASPASAAAAAEANRAYFRCVSNWRAATGATGRTRGDTSTSSRQRAYATAPEMSDARCGPPPSAGTAAGQPGSFRQRNDVVVLVASRTPLGDEALRRRIAGLRVGSEADLRALPSRILGDDLSAWAGYYSQRLPPQHQQERIR